MAYKYLGVSDGIDMQGVTDEMERLQDRDENKEDRARRMKVEDSNTEWANYTHEKIKEDAKVAHETRKTLMRSEINPWGESVYGHAMDERDRVTREFHGDAPPEAPKPDPAMGLTPERQAPPAEAEVMDGMDATGNPITSVDGGKSWATADNTPSEGPIPERGMAAGSARGLAPQKSPAPIVAKLPAPARQGVVRPTAPAKPDPNPTVAKADAVIETAHSQIGSLNKEHQRLEATLKILANKARAASIDPETGEMDEDKYYDYMVNHGAEEVNKQLKANVSSYNEVNAKATQAKFQAQGALIEQLLQIPTPEARQTLYNQLTSPDNPHRVPEVVAKALSSAEMITDPKTGIAYAWLTDGHGKRHQGPQWDNFIQSFNPNSKLGDKSRTLSNNAGTVQVNVAAAKGSKRGDGSNKKIDEAEEYADARAEEEGIDTSTKEGKRKWNGFKAAKLGGNPTKTDLNDNQKTAKVEAMAKAVRDKLKAIVSSKTGKDKDKALADLHGDIGEITSLKKSWQWNDGEDYLRKEVDDARKPKDDGSKPKTDAEKRAALSAPPKPAGVTTPVAPAKKVAPKGLL